MKLFLCPNIYNEKQAEEARACIATLASLGHSVSFDESSALTVFGEKGDERSCPFGIEECDLAVSLGGDGAVLRATQLAHAANKPLVGINSGRLGYLCALTLSDVESFDSILSRCELSSRTLLEIKYNGEAHVALNDVVVAKEHIGSCADLSVGVEGLGTFTVRGDGIVVSTPTGSTAYNRSAGGPVISPDCAVTVITPLHSSRGLNRPVVSPDTGRITVRERYDSAVVVLDGNTLGKICGEVEIYRSKKTLSIYVPRTPLADKESFI